MDEQRQLSSVVLALTGGAPAPWTCFHREPNGRVWSRLRAAACIRQGWQKQGPRLHSPRPRLTISAAAVSLSQNWPELVGSREEAPLEAAILTESRFVRRCVLVRSGLFFQNICLASQSIRFPASTFNLTGDGWASGKIGQLCDCFFDCRAFPHSSFSSDLIGLFTQPLRGSSFQFIQNKTSTPKHPSFIFSAWLCTFYQPLWLPAFCRSSAGPSCVWRTPVLPQPPPPLLFFLSLLLCIVLKL